MKPVDWSYFRQGLLDWYRPERRPMPWKAIKNPYAIWLSEIILQQTRVEQGRPYYERFLAAYPTVADLAAAEEDAVLRLWQGLGYYSRGRNLLKAARLVVSDFGGQFPDTYEELLRLPGVGPYTAAAIASFAFDRALPVVDGNVYRILARYADEELPIDSTTGKRQFAEYARLAMGNAPAARYNQAVMDFGALVCTPRHPSCTQCPLYERCLARKRGTTDQRPVKKPKKARRQRHFHYLLLRQEGHILLERRGEGDIWTGLYQPILLELPVDIDPRTVGADEFDRLPDWIRAAKPEWGRSYPPRSQVLSHQRIIGHFHELAFEGPLDIPDRARWIHQQNIEKYAFPKLIADFFQEKTLSLDLF